MRRVICIFTSALLIVAAGTGCQNTMRVRVERVLYEPDLRLDPNSRLGRQVDAAVADLGDLIGACNNTVEACNRHPDADVLQSAKRMFSGISAEASRLALDCDAYFEVADIAGVKADLRQTLRRVRRFALERRKSIEYAKRQLTQPYAFPSLDSEAEPEKVQARARGTAEVWSSMDEVGRELGETADAATLGFGGYVSTDVYVINPSDPNYRHILDSSSPWSGVAWALFEREVSVEPLTETLVGVTGDSSIMVVVESPGQVRVYQLSNDPTQLVHNIGFIIAKATSAAMKFMSAGTGL